MTRHFIISDKDKFYQMIVDKGITGLHGGIIGDYGPDEYIITLLNEWVPYLDEYGIEYREVYSYLMDGTYEVRYK